MNQTQTDNQNTKQTITGADIPWALKARYFSSGMVVGVFLSPVIRRTIAKVQPKLDTLLDNLTGQAEGFVEKGSDLVAKAKDILRNTTDVVVEEKEHAHVHGSECNH